jgi:hypothetical protein
MILIATSRQFLKELDRPASERSTRTVNRRTSHTRTASSPDLLRTDVLSERQPLLTRRRSFEGQADNGDAQKHTHVAGGTILGIHNLAIVFPQFLVSLFPKPYLLGFPIHSQRLQLHQVQYSNLRMRKLTMILRTPEHFTAKTALPGSFALADFALWCVTLCSYFLYIDDV